MGLGATHSTRRRRWGQANGLVQFAQPNPFKVITTMQMNLRSFCRKRLCVRITPSSPHITAANHRAPNTDPGASGNSVLTRNEKVEPPPRGVPYLASGTEILLQKSMLGTTKLITYATQPRGHQEDKLETGERRNEITRL
ncbi:hypothetical protein ACO22_05691 [Paracoccidioides brasiliensis]|uniref:Uncharacterized protein n=1 Tax=Paracoccidioides brasiliensis TaxID=121759 RepID=A0A1D2J9L5_PARBR|nr:hypothetical protein ACO22_05691 [Paracoccidioides brasiliensis]